MNLKQLLDEVEKARKPLVRSPEKIIGDAVRYEKELMPDLARRLRRAMELLGSAKDHFRDTCPGREMQDGVAIFNGFQAQIETLEGPAMSIRERIRETPGELDVPVGENVTKRCPKCDHPMWWMEASHGWYCTGDLLFIPGGK